MLHPHSPQPHRKGQRRMDAARISPQDIERYYRAALPGLQALEAGERVARRFGAEADARWSQLRGELAARDRLELLLRDAAQTQPLAFAPRVLFALPGLSDDEPLGKDFRGASEALACELLREADTRKAPPTLRALLDEAARVWGVSPSAVDEAVLSSLRPASRVVIAGAGAVVAVSLWLVARAGFDLADQVLLVAETPAVRQLLGLSVAWSRATGRARLLAPQAILTAAEPSVLLSGLGLPHLDLAIISADATPSERDATLRLAPAQVG